MSTPLREIMSAYRHLENDDAPLCINCEWCIHQGFLFHCLLAQTENKAVGSYGIVYWKRKDKVKNYNDVPKTVEECDDYNPLAVSLMNPDDL